MIVHQYGGRVGGPIIIPGLYDGRNKAFFFFNMEHQYQPSEATRTRTILNPQAQQGVFAYLTVGGQRSHGQPARARARQRPDLDARSRRSPALLDEIRAATATTGTVTHAAERDQHPELRLPGGVEAATSTRRRTRSTST